jgi:hypothetical protein
MVSHLIYFLSNQKKYKDACSSTSNQHHIKGPTRNNKIRERHNIENCPGKKDKQRSE